MKRSRKKYRKPAHPWEKERMDSEDKLLQQFGLRRKREIWRTQTLLRRFRQQARRLLTASGPQAKKETKQLIDRLQKLGLVGSGATLDDVLGLTVEKLLERYLQIVVQRKGLAKTPRQARQLVLHGKIAIGDRKVNVPSYLVRVEDEPLIKYMGKGPAPGTQGAETTQAPPATDAPSADAGGEG
jgi:small subunit ribosomal protein S4